MSDDIPPLIPETPPPMTKLDWEDDEDFIDFPHLALEMSESSLSPDGGWNTIDELSLPYDGDVDKQDCIESSTNDSSSNWQSSITNNEQLFQLSEQDPSLHQNNSSIWDETERIKENIKKLTSKHNCDINELIGKSEIGKNISFERVDNNNKEIENVLPLNEQQIHDERHVQLNINSQYSTKLEPRLDNLESVEHNKIVQIEDNVNLEKLGQSETLVNNHLECVDIEESTNPVNFVPNVLLDNKKINENDIKSKGNSINDLSKMVNNDLSINNNNTIKNIEEVKEITLFNSVHLPNMTLIEYNKINENHEHNEQFPNQISNSSINYEHSEISQNISISEEQEEKNVESINRNCSTLQHQQINKINLEDNSGSDFDKFSDFHTFSTIENKPISLINDDEFCDFESGFDQNQFIDVKQNDEILVSESHVQFDYKQFCKDIFYGDNELCEKIDLHNLDNELNTSQIWNNLKDIESSPALNFNWTKSNSNNVFLSSLSIDSRNILYGASWNQKVPKFAANMSDSPLEPLKAFNSTIDTKISDSYSNHPLQEIVPVPEFDWTNSGLINPLDFKPETWKTSEIINEQFIKNEEYTESMNAFDDFLNASFDDQMTESVEKSKPDEVPISLDAQRILNNLPDFEVLQKSYLVILNKENNFFLN